MISTITFFLILLLDLDTPNYHDFIFLNFLVIHFFLYNVLVAIFGNVHRPCRHHFIIINRVSILSILFFSCCMASVAILGNADKPVNNVSTLSKLSYIMSILFLLSFPNFPVSFQIITILGNAHTSCKQCTNIVDNDVHLSLHFFSDFS